MSTSQRIAWIVVPFKEQLEFDRHVHLGQLLHAVGEHVRDMPSTAFDVQVAVVEQLDHERTGTRKFNRGKLLNAGFNEIWNNTEGVFARSARPDDIFVAHDVDLIPNRDLFACYGEATHGRAIHLARSWGRYATSDGSYVGGILAMTCRDLQRANGYSSRYWGWGGEDDDFRVRMAACGICVKPPSSVDGRVQDLERLGLREKLDMLRMSGAKCTDKWELRRSSARRWPSDGLSSLRYRLCAVDNSQCDDGPLTCVTMRVLL